MKKSTSASARILAVAALIAALVLAIVVIGGALGSGSDDSGGKKNGGQAAHSAPSKQKVPATYEIQDGDTLIAIAHRTDVPVGRIEALNPQVDPQILRPGEVLKLR